MSKSKNTYKELKLDKGGAQALYNAWNATMIPKNKSVKKAAPKK